MRIIFLTIFCILSLKANAFYWPETDLKTKKMDPGIIYSITELNHGWLCGKDELGWLDIRYLRKENLLKYIHINLVVQDNSQPQKIWCIFLNNGREIKRFELRRKFDENTQSPSKNIWIAGWNFIRINPERLYLTTILSFKSYAWEFEY